MTAAVTHLRGDRNSKRLLNISLSVLADRGDVDEVGTFGRSNPVSVPPTTFSPNPRSIRCLGVGSPGANCSGAPDGTQSDPTPPSPLVSRFWAQEAGQSASRRAMRVLEATAR